jgi:glycosyltransferase involved in cell wall biosynthesis
MGSPRVVFGMAAYGRHDTLAQVLESLLGQTCQDFAIVIVDDRPLPEVTAIVETYARSDPRITYEANPFRLGMIRNWRKAFERSRELHPASEYFAWVSDHDFWHPRWLEVLVDELDRDPGVVLAHPQIVRIFPKYRKLITRVFDTADVARPIARVRATTSGLITAGNCIYGLFRAAAIEQAGGFPPVLMPDRLLLLHLAILGRFKQVPDYLWYREVSGSFSYKRQRHMLFAERVPLYTYVPVHLQHFGVLVWRFGAVGAGRPVVGRVRGLACAAAQLWYSTKREIVRDDSRWREALRRTALGRRLLPGGRVARALRHRARVTAGGSA